MSQSMRNYLKEKSPAGLVQLSIFGFWLFFKQATMHCIFLYSLWGFAELILEDDAYLLQIELVFLVNHADV